MNLLPLAALLEDAGLGVQAKTIFLNMIPLECPQGILLRNKLQGTRIDYELPGYFKSDFQLIVRSTTYAGGEQLIADVVAALTLTNTAVDEMDFTYMRPTTLPVVYPISKGNLIEFSVDFDVLFTI